MSAPTSRINIEEPRWDQSTYWGRARHFFETTNPLNLLCGTTELEKAKDIVTRYRKGETLDISEDELWRAKNIYDSAFHPDTGEKIFIVGRMSAQVPMGMLITGGMLTFYKSITAVAFWQWCNQSFNAVVNYSNRSGDSPISQQQLGTSYALATGGAMGTALGLNSLVKKMPPLVGRFVPFVAVATANCINIPLMRMKELQDGVPVINEKGERLGFSKKAAQTGISSVVISRIGMAAPGMILIPVIMDKLEKRGMLTRYPYFGAPFQILMCGVFLTFATPMCCAVFPQKSAIEVSNLEPELRERIKKLPDPPKVLYYNKGL